MSESYKVATIIMLVIPTLFGLTTFFAVRSDRLDKPQDAFNVVMSAPSKALENTVSGILGFLGGSALQVVSEKKKREELEKENASLKEENSQLRELERL